MDHTTKTLSLATAAGLFVLACKGDPQPSTDSTETDSSETADDSTDTDSTDTTADTTDATETETGPGPCVMDEDCTNPDAPFCDEGTNTCVDCSGTTDPNGACMGVDPGMAVCSEGACVQCSAEESSACTETTPVCDEGTNTCVGCSEHEQCPDSACNLELGNCMDVDHVVAVDGEGGQMYTTLADALADNDPAPEELTIILYEKNMATPYTESVLIGTGTYVAILAAPGEKPVVQGTGGSPSFAVTTGSTLYLYAVSGSNTPNSLGLEVNDASAWVQRCELVNNDGGGILVDGGGELVLENSFVGGDSNGPALDVISGTLDATYSTFALAPVIGVPSLACADGAGKSVRNSIIVSTHAEPEVACPNITITDSALEMAMGSNVELGEVDIGWFTGYLTGNFSLSGTAPPALATTATWQAGDPATDIGGIELRPTVPGTADYAGADIPP